jgi:hypothetical protein
MQAKGKHAIRPQEERKGVIAMPEGGEQPPITTIKL